ncbi:GNAT family N-acetyltransferase [Streptococcus gallolyticus]|nr:GNAT family N-acetyltransferase [Streptococcus gallolyticus]MBY5040745.1 GNAT family N-acetyltransferase [Streptococcus gallolyticus]
MDWTVKAFSDLSVDELYQVLELRSEVFVLEQECAYQDVDGVDPQCYHLFGKSDGKIVAYLRILPPGLTFSEASIGRVVIKLSHRGQKLAGPMLEAAMQYVIEDMGQETIKISAQTYLEKFYQSQGFVAVSDMYLEDGIPHMDMVYEK